MGILRTGLSMEVNDPLQSKDTIRDLKKNSNLPPSASNKQFTHDLVPYDTTISSCSKGQDSGNERIKTLRCSPREEQVSLVNSN